MRPRQQPERLVDVVETEHLAAEMAHVDRPGVDELDGLRHRLGRVTRAPEDAEPLHHDLVGHDAVDGREVLEPGQQHRAAEGDEVERQRHRLHRGRDVHHDVGHAPAGELAHARDRVGRGDVDHLVRADRARGVEPDAVARRHR